MHTKALLFTFLLPALLIGAEEKTDPQSAALQTILQRLTALEDQNRQLLEEVHALAAGSSGIAVHRQRRHRRLPLPRHSHRLTNEWMWLSAGSRSNPKPK